MRCELFCESHAASLLVQYVDDHDLSFLDEEIALIRSLAPSASFSLLAIRTEDWNDDLSPWECPAVFGEKSFAGNARKTLSSLTEEILPSFRGGFENVAVGGYSLAGLFALWACTQTDLFRGVAASSPSVWYPGFADYIRQNTVNANAVYLSLGDREEKTRNPVMATAGASIRDIHAILEKYVPETVLEWNPGNHFRDPALRTAKGFAWILQR